MKLHTIDEVSSVTGISKRTLKYYVEREIFIPQHEKYEGKKKYWLYTDEDIKKIKQIALYKELHYSADSIKKIVSDPSFDWRKALDNQIDELRRQKKHLENRIFFAEMMRCCADTESEESYKDVITDYGNDIDEITDIMFFDDEDLSKDSILQFSEDFANGLDVKSIKEYSRDFLDIIRKIRGWFELDPTSDEVQRDIDELMRYYTELLNSKVIDPYDILFGLRLVTNISVDRMIDTMFAKEGSTDFVITALSYYCDRKKEKRNG